MSTEDSTRVPLPNEPSTGPPLDTHGAGSVSTAAAGNSEAKPAKLPGVCHHRMESGYYCQSPAVHDRRYCYSHLRLRGQRIRMARAIARRQPYRFDLPALDDLFAVQAAVEHVARALAAGLMKREDATTLLWALQQSAINHRNLALARMYAGAVVSSGAPLNPVLVGWESAGAPPLSSSVGDRVGAQDNHDGTVALEAGNLKLETAGDQKRLVEEYPEFEAEFGLPAGIDVSQPAHVLFPPPEDQWRVPTPARDPKTSVWCHRQPSKHWTMEEIEREELDKQQRTMGQHAYLHEVNKLEERVARQLRKYQEAAWQAEADRRNAALEERERQFGSMNEGERQAYNLGVLRAMEVVQEQEEEEEKRKKRVAKAAAS